MIDSHCHLNDEALYGERAAIVGKALDVGVRALLCVGYDLDSSSKAVRIAHEFPNVYAAVGYQPENIEGVDISALSEIKRLAADDRVVAIGEIGLDYHWFKKEEAGERQKEFLVAQLDMANRLGLPVSIHCRDAIGDLFEIVSKFSIKNKAVLHCYGGSPEMMMRFAKLGCYFGFGGVTTFKNARIPKESAAACPADRLLLETDAPYLAPAPFRGKRNEPAYIPYILKEIATLRGEDEKELERQTDLNFQNLFHVKL